MILAGQIIDSWEVFLANAALSLKIKYGLPNDPSDAEVQRWLARVGELVGRGIDRETAGRTAAAEIFKGVGTCKYASVADDIEAILNAARRRDD